MSIESIHAYRFGYLKSEQWQTVRLEALVREKGKCQICSEESIHNDAHHVWYPESIYETTEKHLVVLCRDCHEYIHDIMPECKTRNEEEGLAVWRKFRNSIRDWRVKKDPIFRDIKDAIGSFGAKDLRIAYDKVKAELKHQQFIVSEYEKQFGGIKPEVPEIMTEEEKVDEMCKTIKKWALSHFQRNRNSPKVVDNIGYVI